MTDFKALDESMKQKITTKRITSEWSNETWANIIKTGGTWVEWNIDGDRVWTINTPKEGKMAENRTLDELIAERQRAVAEWEALPEHNKGGDMTYNQNPIWHCPACGCAAYHPKTFNKHYHNASGTPNLFCACDDCGYSRYEKVVP